MKVKELALSAIGDSADVDIALACKWVSDRFVELAILIEAIPYRKQKQFVFPKNVSTGTVTLTNGSNKVVGNSAAQAVWIPDLVGRFIRVDSDNGWYQIINVGTDLTLATTYAGDTVTAGGYRIVTRVVALEKSVRSVNSFVNNRFGLPIHRINQSEMDLRFPNRTDVDGGPLLHSEVGLDAEDRHLVEFYPYSSKDVLITYMAFVEPAPLDPEMEIPSFIPSYIMIEGVKLNIYEHLTGKASNDTDANKMAVLGNLKARQGTIWKGAKTDFKNVSGIYEESKVTVQSYGRSIRRDFDITNAREHILAGWTPLV